MKKKSQLTDVTVEDILAGHRTQVQVVAQRLRQLIRHTVPEAREVPYPGWHAIGYRHPTAGYFAGIFPLEQAVQLVFEFGVLLPDPEGVLEGNGKQVRFITLDEESLVSGESLVKLLQAALQLPEKRSVKLAMIRAAARPAAGEG
jgi:hypothetical protein